ncbi:hypothetical protein L1049_016851 [Liquidambar formosana]|uniref:Auxin-responsive protein n=1 Tax=Liquidambar formosana TaxID=63359 RepID=A0AAP0S711_LIQFO
MGRAAADSSSSSIDSSNHPSLSCASSVSLPNWSNSTRDLSTDLRLGLSISPNHDFSSTSTPREQRLHWPPIKPHLRSTLAGKADKRRQASLFIKVYMEGIPIGRKLDLLAHEGYDGLISTLGHMFRTTILCPDVNRIHPEKYHVLTYEDKEGDWMMVGDVPWEMFLTTVKRMKIARGDRC